MIDVVKQIGVARSFIEPKALAEVVAAKYDVGNVISCKLFSKMLRTQDNDHYLVETEIGERYAMRVYQNGRHLLRQESDYRFELTWLDFLHQEGLPVSFPVRRRDGQFLGGIAAPEGIRYYALFSYAEGEPMSPTYEDQLYICGVNMARIHIASNSFHTTYNRQPLDLGFLIDRSMARLRHHWTEHEEKQEELIDLLTSAKTLKGRIQTLMLPSKGDTWGVIGGDFHSANTRFNEQNEPTFFNFDLCGYGWRAYDIATFLSNSNIINSAVSLSETFYAGYTSVRKLSEAEQMAINDFVAIRRIWLMGTLAVTEGLGGHTFVAAA